MSATFADSKRSKEIAGEVRQHRIGKIWTITRWNQSKVCWSAAALTGCRAAILGSEPDIMHWGAPTIAKGEAAAMLMLAVDQ